MSSTLVATPAQQTINIRSLILMPALVTLGVTVLRLVGELRGWPDALFSRNMGGSLVAIAWLAPVFGIYFALKLVKLGKPPDSYLRAIKYAIFGFIVLVVCAFAPSTLRIKHGFYDRLIYGWVFFAAAAAVTYRGWPQLFKTLLAYAYAARIPVVIIMFLALRGNWGTHYDALPTDMPSLSFASTFLWLAFFPQLILWVAYTILAGMLFGTIAAGIALLVKIDRGSPV